MKWKQIAALSVLAGSLASCGGSSATAASAIPRFVTAWNQGDYAAMASLIYDPAPDFAADTMAITSGLDSTGTDHVATLVGAKGDTATVGVDSTYRLPQVGTWDVHSTLTLVKKGGRWLVLWSPTAVDPALQPGDRLQANYSWAPGLPYWVPGVPH
jgi:hypothetical protein